MNEKVLKTLEYNKIIARLAEYASSEDAKKRCLTLTPGTDINEINLLQLQTKDALNRLFKGGRISFSGVHDIRDSLKRLEIGASLSITELLRVCSLLEAAKRAKAFSRTSIGHTGPDRPAAADGTDELPVDSLTGFSIRLSRSHRYAMRSAVAFYQRTRSRTMPAVRSAPSANPCVA